MAKSKTLYVELKCHRVASASAAAAAAAVVPQSCGAAAAEVQGTHRVSLPPRSGANSNSRVCRPNAVVTNEFVTRAPHLGPR